MKKLLAFLTVTVGAAVAFADGESLAETGGYVPVNVPGLAFKNITLAELGTTWFPSVTKGGGWAGGEAKVPLVLRTEETNDGGKVNIVAARTGSAKLSVAGTATYNGAVNIVVDFGAASVPGGFKVPLLEATNLPALANVSVTDNAGAHKWRTEVVGNVLWAMSDGSFTILIR